VPRAERVLISAFVGSDNLGDEAVFLALARQLAGRLGGRRLTVASLDTAKTRALLDGPGDPELAAVEVLPRARLPVAIAWHDLCVFGGGGIVQDQARRGIPADRCAHEGEAQLTMIARPAAKYRRRLSPMALVTIIGAVIITEWLLITWLF